MVVAGVVDVVVLVVVVLLVVVVFVALVVVIGASVAVKSDMFGMRSSRSSSSSLRVSKLILVSVYGSAT